MGKLTNKIQELEFKIVALESKILELSKNTESMRVKPESIISQIDLSKTTPMPSTGTGLGKMPGASGGIIFNDADAQNVAFGQNPPQPSKGYNKHGHNEFSGGALDINTLKLVEYVRNPSGIILDQYGNPLNESCQSYWKNPAQIAKDGDVEKIGHLEIEFDKNSKKWLAGGIIDVKKTNLVMKDVDGKVMKDSKGQEMKAPMYGIETDTQNVVWDKNAQVWRFYAVFADEE